MSKFCVNCGAKLGNNSKFCTSCGTACTNTVAGSSDDVQAAPINNLTSLLKKYKIVFLILLLLAAALTTTTIIMSDSSYKEVVDGIITAFEDEDGEKLLKYMATDEMIEFFDEDGMDEMIDELNYECQSLTEELEEDLVGADPKWDCSIKSSKKMSKKEISELQEKVSDRWAYDGIDTDITSGYRVKLDLTISGDDDDWDTNSVFYIIKVDEKWIFSHWEFKYEDREGRLINPVLYH